MAAGVEELEEGPTHEDLGAGRPDQPGRRGVGEDDPLRRVGDHDGIRQELDQPPVPGLGLAECLFRPFRRRVVEEVAPDLLDLAAGIGHHDRVLHHMDAHAVAPLPHALVLFEFPARPEFCEERGVLRLLRVERAQVRPERLLPALEPQDRDEGGIAVEDSPLRCGEVVPRQVVLEQPAIPLLTLPERLIRVLRRLELCDPCGRQGQVSPQRPDHGGRRGARGPWFRHRASQVVRQIRVC